VSIESGERPSGRLWREGCGVECEGEVAILSGLTFCWMIRSLCCDEH
jgi:hypothetical protein